MTTHSAKQSHGFVGDHPGLIAALFAIAVTGVFLFLLYSSATAHQAGGHGAPAGSAAPAAHQ